MGAASFSGTPGGGGLSRGWLIDSPSPAARAGLHWSASCAASLLLLTLRLTHTEKPLRHNTCILNAVQRLSFSGVFRSLVSVPELNPEDLFVALGLLLLQWVLVKQLVQLGCRIAGFYHHCGNFRKKSLKQLASAAVCRPLLPSPLITFLDFIRRIPEKSTEAIPRNHSILTLAELLPELLNFAYKFIFSHTKSYNITGFLISCQLLQPLSYFVVVPPIVTKRG